MDTPRARSALSPRLLTPAVALLILGMFFRPALGHCLEDERAGHSPLYGVVLGRTLSGISADPASGTARPAVTPNYNPRKPADEELTTAERRLLLGDAVDARPSASGSRTRDAGPSNPSGTVRARGGMGAAWAKSIALMKKVKAERERRAKEPIDKGVPWIPASGHSSPMDSSVPLAVMTNSGVGLIVPLLLAAPPIPPPGQPTAQAGSETACWVPNGYEPPGMEPVATVCYVVDGTPGGKAVATCCYVVDPAGNAHAQATACYDITDANSDGNDDGGNHGGTVHATACYDINDADGNGQDDAGNHGGDVHATACYDITDANNDGRDDNGNHGGQGGATACYDITDNDSNGRDDNGNHGGEGGQTVCYTITDGDSNGRDDAGDHGGDGNSTACYAITDQTGGPGGSQDGRDDNGNHGGDAQSTSCWSITDSCGDGTDDGGNHRGSPVETMCYAVMPGGPVGGNPQATACYADAVLPNPGGVGQDTVCYTEDPNSLGGEANETVCYDVTQQGPLGGAATETLCYTYEGSPEDAKPTPTQCYSTSGGGGVGGEGFGECITHVIAEPHNTPSTQDDYVPIIPAATIAVRMKWDTPGLEAPVTFEPNSRVSISPTSLNPLTYNWTSTTVTPQAMSSATGDALVTVKTVDAEGATKEVGEATVTVYSLAIQYLPHDYFSTARSMDELGLLEEVSLSYTVDPSTVSIQNIGGLTWEFAAGCTAGTLENIGNNTGAANYTADEEDQQTAFLRLVIQNGPAANKYLQKLVVSLAPAGVAYVRLNNYMYHDKDRASAGYITNVFLMPTRVSFHWLEYGEGSCDCVGSGWFAGGGTHAANTFGNIGLGDINTGCQVNNTDDCSYAAGWTASNFFDGVLYSPIPARYRVPGSGDEGWEDFGLAPGYYYMKDTGRVDVKREPAGKDGREYAAGTENPYTGPVGD